MDDDGSLCWFSFVEMDKFEMDCVINKLSIFYVLETIQQPENINLSAAERIYGADRPPSASLWSSQALPHSHNLNHSIVNSEKRTSQPHYDEYEHIESNNTHGKRRHRVSPMR